jgi:hypothetical protein
MIENTPRLSGMQERAQTPTLEKQSSKTRHPARLLAGNSGRISLNAGKIKAPEQALIIPDRGFISLNEVKELAAPSNTLLRTARPLNMDSKGNSTMPSNQIRYEVTNEGQPPSPSRPKPGGAFTTA